MHQDLSSNMATAIRGSCHVALLLCLLLIVWSPLHSLAASHIVGDSEGWGFAISDAKWANGKRFAAGDTLVFNYQAGLHNVVPVNAAGYKSCRASGSTATNAAATTGNDKFTLKNGPNYFICSVPGHCEAGMKIQVIAN